jgi:hypothetical protein
LYAVARAGILVPLQLSFNFSAGNELGDEVNELIDAHQIVFAYFNA